jgi:hypothetical protein
MEDRFDNRDFEQFIKQNADQYRMFPSEKVWNDIHDTLHARRRWYGIGLALLLLTTAVVTWVMLLSPAGKQKQVAANPSSVSTKNITEQKQQPVIHIVPVKSIAGRNNNQASSVSTQENLFFVSANSDLNDLRDNNSDIAESEKINPVVAIQQPMVTNQSLVISKPTAPQHKVMVQDPVVALNKQKEVAGKLDELFIASTNPEKGTETSLFNNTINTDKDIYPLSIESVVNSYKYTRKKKKLSWQLYAVPTVSYRALKENMTFIRAARSNGTIPTNTLPPDLNSVIAHKPDIGFELGFTTGYPVSKNLKFLGGLQFNVTKYDIRAYFNYQSEVTTIALNSGAGANSVSTLSNYRSTNAGNTENKGNWLRNLYFSVSAPVGAEIVFNSTKKTYAGFTATVQPTYMLSNKAYLISTDFKNYAEVPSLVRKWNMNTGFEIFAGYNAGKTQWRIGPQLRYQALSSFEDKYPVREHLFDFGIKVGVMLK